LTIGIALNGATGRMGANQHLLRSLAAIRDDGGVALASGERVVPAPVLIGRAPAKLADLAARAGGVPWSTDLDTVLADPGIGIYFDAQTTARRVPDTLRAIAAGKHVYCEKPTRPTPSSTRCRRRTG